MKYLELRIPPVVLAWVFALAMWGLAWVMPSPIGVLPATLATTLALLLLCAGVLCAVLGVLAIRRAQTTVNPFTPQDTSVLVISGIYRYSRNPIYLGFLLALIAWWLYLGSWSAALPLPVFVLCMNRLQIQPEERALAAKFASQFSAYTLAVRRWL